MMDFEIEKIKECIENSQLCAINRDMIDELSMYCFPIAMSDRLVLAVNVYDFNIDGYKIVRTEDISEVFCDEAEDFNEMIIRKEGILDNFKPEKIDIQNLKNVFNHFLETKQNIIVQCEGYNESLFYVGSVAKIGKGEIFLKTFDGIGIIDEKEARIPLNKITCVSYGSRYINIISKYIRES